MAERSGPEFDVSTLAEVDGSGSSPQIKQRQLNQERHKPRCLFIFDFLYTFEEHQTKKA